MLLKNGKQWTKNAETQQNLNAKKRLATHRCFSLKVQVIIKALVIEDTLLPMMFLGLRNVGNVCCGSKMFLNKIRNIFCVPDTKLVSATNVARAGKRGNICVGNNVSVTMCPRLPGPLWSRLQRSSWAILFWAKQAPNSKNDSSKDSEVDNRQIPSQLQVFPLPANFEGCQDQFRSQILGFFGD